MPSRLPDDVYAVILAGGSGTRFWPKSRHLKPKQLCRIGSGEATMLEITLARLDGLVPPERRLIVTHADQVAETRRIAGERCATVLAEPEARNTAAALALAALQVRAQHASGNPVMLSLHADHVVENVPAFHDALTAGVAIARTGQLALIGIVPRYPETGYGYIERGEPLPPPLAGHRVARFREKPDLATAQQFLARGGFFWNAGLFVWQVDVLLEELRASVPALVDRLAPLATGARRGFLDVPPAQLAAAYATLPKISIDHAVLEVSRRVAVVEADIGWQDVGSWDALARCFPTDAAGNIAFGDALLLDSRGTTVDTDGPFVATVGLEDHVVVVSGGAVLVCPKDRAQDVKMVVDWLKERGRKDLL